MVGYLDKREMDALLAAPDQQTERGRRDYAILVFLYNTGARATEVATLKIGDLSLHGTPSVRLIGKGEKVRYAEAFEVCEYGRRPSEDELRTKLFPFLGE